MKRRRPKPRNPIARVVRKLRPKVVPDKRRKLRDNSEKSETGRKDHERPS